MPKLIQYCENNNTPLVDNNDSVLPRTYFNIIRLNKSDRFTNLLKCYESVYVVLKGNCDFIVNGKCFDSVGKRDDIWNGKADSIYVGVAQNIEIISNSDGVEIAVAGGSCDKSYAPFRIKPEDVDMVDVGSVETHSHRKIFHILGHNGNGKAGNLLVSELYCDDGCWSGYPPHKHCKDIQTPTGFEETGFEEVYHYRFNPSNGFGCQFLFNDDIERKCKMIMNGDTVLIEDGYHPTVTSPGHKIYIFTILVGHTQRSLVQNFKPEYRHLMNKIPGINDMCSKFK